MDATFGLPEVEIGIIPSSGGTLRLVRAVGPARAKELMLLRTRLTAAEALQLGLVTEVVDDVEARAMEMAVQLAQLPPLAASIAKQACDRIPEAGRDAALLIERLAYAALAKTDECRHSSAGVDGAPDPRFDVLFERVDIGPVTLPNRFYQVPHCTGFGVEKPLSQAAHRRVKAEGGWGGVCTEYAAVSRDSDESPYVSARMWDEGDADALRLTTEAVHAHGALAGIELSHTGVHGENSESRLPPLAPSQLAGDFALGAVPKAMTIADIRRVQDDWVRAAELSRDAGFDIVYVYGGHTYLPGQFLSPYYNRRDDEYGGSLRNRARFWLETLERVRDAVGERCAVACRVAVSRAEAVAGIELDEGLEFVRMADDLVDLWDVNIGSIAEWSQDSGPSRFFAEGWQLEYTGRVREATAKPIVGVGRITDPYLMERDRAQRRLGSDRRRPALDRRPVPARPRSTRAGWTRSASASAATSASPRPTAAATSAAPRTRPRARSTAAAGTPSGVEPLRERRPRRAGRRRRAGRHGVRGHAGQARRAARATWSSAAPLAGGTCAGSRGCPGWASGGGWSAWRDGAARRLRRPRDRARARGWTPRTCASYGADIVVVATGSHWAADGLNRLHPRRRSPAPTRRWPTC